MLVECGLFVGFVVVVVVVVVVVWDGGFLNVLVND